MRLPRTRTVSTGSPTWWRRILTDVALRMAVLALVLFDVITGHGWGRALGIVCVVLLTLLLVFPVAACISVLLGRAGQTDRDPDT